MLYFIAILGMTRLAVHSQYRHDWIRNVIQLSTGRNVELLFNAGGGGPAISGKNHPLARNSPRIDRLRSVARKRRKPRCIVIAGPNGAGKTTFARDYLSAIAGIVHFVNVDLIAGGISPLRPELAAVTAGRVVLRELDRLVDAKADLAFESTLSGLRYAKRMQEWKAQGYSIEINYIRLPSSQLALIRVAARVKQGGHNVARTDVLRRYKRSWTNFLEVYRSLADHWTIYDNSEATPRLLERGP